MKIQCLASCLSSQFMYPRTQGWNEGFIQEVGTIQKCGATYLYLIIAQMFQMTTNVVTALKSIVTRFSKDGMANIKAENVFLAAKQLTAVVKSLAQVDALLDEAV